MKRDGEIKLLLDERGKGVSQKVAAARVGMSERTVRKYERLGKLPSQLRKPRTHRTRENRSRPTGCGSKSRFAKIRRCRQRPYSRSYAKRSRGAIRKDSCVRCSGTCRHGAFAMGRSRK